MSVIYRYFESPHDFSTYRHEPAACDLCGREGPGYAEPFYGERDIAFVCEDCLSSGRLQEYDISMNEGDVAELQQQLRASRPDLGNAELQEVVRERTAELSHRTPHLVTWQDFSWPAHCGDYCRFVKEVGKPELGALSPEGDGVAFLAAHARDIKDMGHAHVIWDSVRPDVPADGSIAYSLGVYSFRCIACGEYVLLWDCD